MNVGELKKILEKYPDEMEVLTDRYSDYAPVDEVEVVKAVPQFGSWVMRSHPTMCEENKAKEKEYIHLNYNEV